MRFDQVRLLCALLRVRTVERWLSVAAVAIVLAAFSAAADDELASFLFSDNWGPLELAA